MSVAMTKEGAMQKGAQVLMQNIGNTSSRAAAYASASGDDHAATSVSAFIAHFDEAARARLLRMNEKLMQLEMQMQAMEAEVSRANEFAGYWT